MCAMRYVCAQRACPTWGGHASSPPCGLLALQWAQSHAQHPSSIMLHQFYAPTQTHEGMHVKWVWAAVPWAAGLVHLVGTLHTMHVFGVIPTRCC